MYSTKPSLFVLTLLLAAPACLFHDIDSVRLRTESAASSDAAVVDADQVVTDGAVPDQARRPDVNLPDVAGPDLAGPDVDRPDMCTPESDSAMCARMAVECARHSWTDNCGMTRTVECGTCPNQKPVCLTDFSCGCGDGLSCAVTHPTCGPVGCECMGSSCTNAFTCNDPLSNLCGCKQNSDCRPGVCNGGYCDCANDGTLCDVGETCQSATAGACTCNGGSCP